MVIYQGNVPPALRDDRKELIMENAVEKYLHKGEEIFWSSQPEKFSLMEKSSKPSVLLNWCATTAVTVLFLCYYFLVLCSGTFSPVFVGMVLMTAAVIMYIPVRKQRNLQGARYYITNQRAMLVTKDASYYCLDLKDLDSVQDVQDRAGKTCLVLGSGLEKSLKKGVDWRSRNVELSTRTEGPWDYVTSLLFFRAEDTDGALEALRQAGAGV